MRALGATDLQKEALQVCSIVLKTFLILVHFSSFIYITSSVQVLPPFPLCCYNKMLAAPRKIRSQIEQI